MGTIKQPAVVPDRTLTIDLIFPGPSRFEMGWGQKQAWIISVGLSDRIERTQVRVDAAPTGGTFLFSLRCALANIPGGDCDA